MRSLVVRFGIAALAVGLLSGVASADAIEDRQKVMKANGDAMKALAAMAKGEAAFDAAAVASNANTIVDDLTRVKDMFPEGSQAGEKETWAKPEIWSDTATFDATRMKAIELANAVAGAGDQAALGAALGALGNDGCKACHEKFRRPKDN